MTFNPFLTLLKLKSLVDRFKITDILSQQYRRGGRAAEGAPLLREYGGKTSIEGSNPSLSAKSMCARSSVG